MLTLILALLSHNPAHAARELHCRDVKAGPDHGYYAVVQGLSSADVTSQSIMGPRPVARLRCVVPRNVRIPGRPHLIALCSNPEGWMLYLRANAQNGREATLARGERNVAMLNCR